VSEIEPFPCAALAHHYPSVPNLGDVTKITEQDIAALGPIDLVVFGSPCQDLSVAGHRKGLINADGTVTRSGLFFTAVNIFQWARRHCGARFALWENVPGAFSSNKGRDFGAVVEFLAGLDEVPVPPKGWGNEGVALGSNGLVEWATLDAQWFGVAQRRRRVFALLDTGDWSNRPPILLESESLRGDSAPSRGTGEAVTPTIRAGAPNGGAGHGARSGDSKDELIVPVVGTMKSCAGSGGWSNSADHAAAGYMVPVCMSSGQANAEVAIERSPTLNCLHEAPIVVTTQYGDVAGSLTARHDSSPCADRGTNVCAYSTLPFDTTQITSPQSGNNPQYGGPCHPLAAGAHAPAIAFDVVGNCLRAKANDPHRLDAGNYASVGMQVRRLTPTECERLQGFSDNYTNIPWRKQPTAPDGPRYKALGNSMAVPVMRWIGERIDLATRDSAALKRQFHTDITVKEEA